MLSQEDGGPMSQHQAMIVTGSPSNSSFKIGRAELLGRLVSGAVKEAVLLTRLYLEGQNLIEINVQR